jgi:hypothetical protein
MLDVRLRRRGQTELRQTQQPARTLIRALERKLLGHSVLVDGRRAFEQGRHGRLDVPIAALVKVMWLEGWQDVGDGKAVQ